MHGVATPKILFSAKTTSSGVERSENVVNPRRSANMVVRSTTAPPSAACDGSAISVVANARELQGGERGLGRRTASIGIRVVPRLRRRKVGWVVETSLAYEADPQYVSTKALAYPVQRYGQEAFLVIDNAGLAADCDKGIQPLYLIALVCQSGGGSPQDIDLSLGERKARGKAARNETHFLLGPSHLLAALHRCDESLERGPIFSLNTPDRLVHRDAVEQPGVRTLPDPLQVRAVSDEAVRKGQKKMPLPPGQLPALGEYDHNEALGKEHERRDDPYENGRRSAPVKEEVTSRREHVQGDARRGQKC